MMTCRLLQKCDGHLEKIDQSEFDSSHDTTSPSHRSRPLQKALDGHPEKTDQSEFDLSHDTTSPSYRSQKGTYK